MGDDAVRVDTSGLDEVIQQMKQMHETSGKAARAMLTAGANEFQREWINAAIRNKHVKTGDMKDSVASTGVRDRDGALSSEIYPQGTGRTGVSNALKAYVLHWGRAGKRTIPASQWVEEVEHKATPKATEVMADVWGEFVQTGKVPKVQKLEQGQK